MIEAYKKEVDRTLIRESLKLTVHQRFERLMDLQRFTLTSTLGPLRSPGGDRQRGDRAAGRPKDLEAVAELEAIRVQRERFET